MGLYGGLLGDHYLGVIKGDTGSLDYVSFAVKDFKFKLPHQT